MKTSISLQMTGEPENKIVETIKNYGTKIFGFIRSKVNNTEDAKDILQEVWFQLSRLTNIDDIENIGGWLYYVAKNKITDNYRKQKPESLDNYLWETEDGEFSIKEILLLDDSKNPEIGLFKEIFWEELITALNELPENQRQVFILNEIEDLTLKEIADKTNTNIKTIISRKGYAIKHLRKKLNDLYQELLN